MPCLAAIPRHPNPHFSSHQLSCRGESWLSPRRGVYRQREILQGRCPPFPSSGEGYHLRLLTSPTVTASCASKGARPRSSPKEGDPLPKQTITHRPIVLKWSPWRLWTTVQRRAYKMSETRIPHSAGVYQVLDPRRGEIVYVGRTNNLWRRVKGLVGGRHKPGDRIPEREQQRLKIRWAPTDRHGCAEDELLLRHRRRHGKAPVYNRPRN